MTKKIKILIVEDDPNLGFILQESLEAQGYEIIRCENGAQAHEAFFKNTFDLCLVDIMLPKMDGFSLAKEIRNVDSKVPIIFLTAKSLKEDKIEGFKIGADDYVTKPFSMEELQLRISAVLRRTQNMSDDSKETIFTIGKYTFYYSEQILKYRRKSLKLTLKESELLYLLCKHRDKYLARELALQYIWNDESYFSGRSMDVYITKLRKYLQEDDRIEIRNLHGKGFRLIVPDSTTH